MVCENKAISVLLETMQTFIVEHKETYMPHTSKTKVLFFC